MKRLVNREPVTEGIGDGFGCTRGCSALAKLGQIIPFARGASLSRSVPPPRAEQGHLCVVFHHSPAEVSSFLSASCQSGFRHNLWLWFTHQNPSPSGCLESKFHSWRGRYEQHTLSSGSGDWGAGSQRFLSGICPSCARNCPGQPQGDEVQQPRFPSSRETWGTLPNLHQELLWVPKSSTL